MVDQLPVGDRWAESTLERVSRVGQQVLKRTASRRVCWPEEKDYGRNPIQDPLVYTTLDEAFASMLQYMSTTSRQCKTILDKDRGIAQSLVCELVSHQIDTSQSTPGSSKVVRYYTSSSQSKSPCDRHHCDRFHNPENITKYSGNPLQRSENVHIVVDPGTYAVSAGAWGTTQQQTHIVHVNDGSPVSVDFVL